jgi:F-type H+-transporting ATPase subunit delta
MTSAVASRYARAFADVIMAPGVQFPPYEAVAQLRSIEDVLEQSEDLRHALSSPAVRLGQKRAVLGKFAEELNLKLFTRNFLSVLIDHRRIDILPQIREAFEAEVDQRLGFVRAEVVSAQELEPQQTAALETGLGQMTGKQVKARFRVDPALIGGVVARMGSTVYDGSIKGQLENLRRQIAEHTAAGI